MTNFDKIKRVRPAKDLAALPKSDNNVESLPGIGQIVLTLPATRSTGPSDTAGTIGQNDLQSSKDEQGAPQQARNEQGGMEKGDIFYLLDDFNAVQFTLDLSAILKTIEQGKAIAIITAWVELLRGCNSFCLSKFAHDESERVNVILERHKPKPTDRRTLSNALRFKILNRDQYTCQYCGRKSPNVVLHIDHKLPVTLGGTDEETNLTTACSDCNIGKSNRFNTAETNEEQSGKLQ